MTQLFIWDGQSVGISVSVLLINSQVWFPLGLIGLISLQSKGLSSFLQHHSLKASLLQCSAFFMVQVSHLYMTTRKTIALIIGTYVSKAVSLLFNMLCMPVIAFLPGSKCLLISWLQSPSALILEPKKIKSVTASTFSPSIFYEVMGLEATVLDFWILSFKPTFLLSSFTFMNWLFNSSSLSAIRVVSSTYLRWLIFLLANLIPACDSPSSAFRKRRSWHPVPSLHGK